MHVTAVTPLYPPKSRVGAWLATHELLRGLVEKGHTVEVVPFVSRPGKRYDLGGVHVLPIAMLDEALGRADVVVSHLGDGGAHHRKAVSLRKPSVVMVHGGNMDPKLLTGAALVVCNSEATKAQISRWMGTKIVVNPPTDPKKYRTTPGDMITLINLSSAKGGDLFWRVARVMPDRKFLGVVGCYGNQTMFKVPNVEVIGTTSNMRDDVYARTKLLLMPSMAESWGMTALEAMCSGIPVLAKPTPGLREAMGSAGLWQEGTSTSQWVTKIKSVLEPEHWLDASEKCLERAALLDPEASKMSFARALEALVDKDVA